MRKCLMRRSQRQTIYLFLIVAVLFLINRRLTQVEVVDEEDEYLTPVKVVEEKHSNCEPSEAKEIQCAADNGKSMKCWKDDEDVYFPVNFIKKRFDMTAKAGKDGNSFDLFTSYSKMRIPEEKYVPSGAFGHFSTYSVETRDRVRCICGKTDVPMSTQWDSIPYYYPIQIAQYGLQHYSRMINDKNKTKRIEIIKGEKSSEWKGAVGMDDTTERLFFNDPQMGKLINISAEASLANAGAYVYLDNSPDLHVISFDWKPLNENSSFTILAKLKKDDLLILLNYVFNEKSKKCVWKEEEEKNDEIKRKKDDQISFLYSFSKKEKIGSWIHVSRDILVDVSRALSSEENRKKEDNIILHPGDIRLVSIGFRGKLVIRQKIAQSNDQHLFAFQSAAQWLIENQNDDGGWKVPVERSIADKKLILSPGWHSSMAQGHAISVLTRAYYYFNDFKYLKAAIEAIQLFQKNSADGGVKAEFFGNVWYEEYPTTPGSFVLNGFLYSLIGLYDLSKLKIHEKDSTPEIVEKLKLAENLYKNGVESVRKLLPLFDTGSGTIYDLRHVGLQTAPNLARWDYHAVHVYLLKWLAMIEKDELDSDRMMEKTAERWIGYANGKKAKHN